MLVDQSSHIYNPCIFSLVIRNCLDMSMYFAIMHVTVTFGVFHGTVLCQNAS